MLPSESAQTLRDCSKAPPRRFQPIRPHLCDTFRADRQRIARYLRWVLARHCWPTGLHINEYHNQMTCCQTRACTRMECVTQSCARFGDEVLSVELTVHRRSDPDGWRRQRRRMADPAAGARPAPFRVFLSITLSRYALVPGYELLIRIGVANAGMR